jgi:hypothetical protein
VTGIKYYFGALGPTLLFWKNLLKNVDQMISANILLIAVLLIGLFLILIEERNTHGQPRM